jgi:hypothetical protein
MNSDPDKIDEVADGLDDLTTTVEEVEDNPPSDVDRRTIQKLKDTLEEATSIADDLEEQKGS